jgi:hypothetical protein
LKKNKLAKLKILFGSRKQNRTKQGKIVEDLIGEIELKSVNLNSSLSSLILQHPAITRSLGTKKDKF